MAHVLKILAAPWLKIAVLEGNGGCAEPEQGRRWCEGVEDYDVERGHGRLEEGRGAGMWGNSIPGEGKHRCEALRWAPGMRETTWRLGLEAEARGEEQLMKLENAINHGNAETDI